ncbi:Peptidyl-prolyl cis-trans isomerase FKBP4 [Chamberlinius hualienensis]
MTQETEMDVDMLSPPSSQKMEPYAPGPDAVDLTPEQDGGILKEIKVRGSGTTKPLQQDRVTVHYTGYFPDGSVFDSSRDRNDKFEFTLGRGDVIKAWDLGVSSMLRGEVATLYCKPEYAYGAAGSPPKIPADATLVFEIELFDWKGEDLTKDKDGGIIRTQISKGTGYIRPKSGATVEIHLIAKYNNVVFDERDLTFVLGEGSVERIPEGVEKGLEKFLKGERSVLTLSPKYAFENVEKLEFDIPRDAILEYDITLKSFEKAKEMWEMDTKEKIEQSNIFKSKGTDLFKKENYKGALMWYTKINDYLESEENISDEEQNKDCNQLKLAAFLNSAMCQLKLKNYIEARDLCNNALKIDPLNVKGLFRRGQAYLSLNDFELALQDFNTVKPLDPSNKAVVNSIVQANSLIKKEKEKERKTYANMFAKFAAQDEEREKKKLGNVMENPGTWDLKPEDKVEGENKEINEKDEAQIEI